MLRGIYSGGVRKQNGHYQSGKSSYWKTITTGVGWRDITFAPCLVTRWNIKSINTITGTKPITLEYYTDIDYTSQYPNSAAVVGPERVAYYMGSMRNYRPVLSSYDTERINYNNEEYRFHATGIGDLLNEANGYYYAMLEWYFQKARSAGSSNWNSLSKWLASTGYYPSIDPLLVSFVNPRVQGSQNQNANIILDGQVHQLTFDYNYSLRKADFLNISSQAVDSLAMQLFPDDLNWGLGTELYLYLSQGGDPDGKITLHYQTF